MFVLLFVLSLFSNCLICSLLTSCCSPSYLLQIGGQGGSGGGPNSDSKGGPGDPYDDTVDSLPEVLRPGSGGGGGAGHPAGYGKGGAGGAGGASIKLHSLEDIIINGIITANGGDGEFGVFENGRTSK